jgi:hypothetical protein
VVAVALARLRHVDEEGRAQQALEGQPVDGGSARGEVARRVDVGAARSEIARL